MNNITIFRDPLHGYAHYKFKGRESKLFFDGNVFKIDEPDFDGEIISRIPEFTFYAIPTTDGIRTFGYISLGPSSPSRNGGGGRRGVTILDEGVIQGTTSNINFTGAGVTVTFVNGQANVDIPDGSAGMIGGSGTLNRIPKFTPNGTTLGDSLLFDNGTSVLFGGTTAIPSAGIAMTSTSQGFLTPRMTTAQRNAIVAPATGLLIYNTSTSLFSYWDGVTWQNIDSQAGGDVSGSGITGNISYWTDGPNSVLGDTGIAFGNVYVQGGNSFGANAILGTNDAFSLSFETSGVTRETISSTGLFGINTAPVAGTLVTVQSTGITNATWIEQWYNSTGAPVPTILLFGVRDDGYISAGLVNGSMTIGFDSDFDAAVAGNTFLGVSVVGAQALTTGNSNTGVGFNALHNLTSGASNVGVGQNAIFSVTTGSDNVGIGFLSLNIMSTGIRNIGIGSGALSSLVSGIRNVGIGYNSFMSETGDDNVGLGALTGNSNVGSTNTAIGSAALFTNATGSGNVCLGFNAGYFHLGSNMLFIDNTTRLNEADGLVKALATGLFAATTTAQWWRHNSNVGILTNTFGTGADGVLGILNGTEPSTSPADMIQIFSVNVGATPLASLGLRTEEAVSAIDVTVPTFRLKVKINGAERYLILGTVI